MFALSLQSGSNGNCMYVETQDVKLLFDAGICGIEAEQRLAAYGRDIRDVDAILISHDHADHIRHVGVYQRKFGLPVYLTEKTFYRAAKFNALGKFHDLNYFLAGDQLQFGEVSVETIPTAHDAVDGVAFVVSSAGKRLGIMTDLGHAFKELFPVMESLDAVFLESNYDREMLVRGTYPAFLKKRIQGPQGHLSNLEAAELLQAGTKLKWACLAHLSEKNNSVPVALKTHREIVGTDLTLHVADRYRPTEMPLV